MGYRRPERISRRHDVDDFECGEPALDEWLKKYARNADAGGTSAVFVVTTDESPVVVAYYALAAAQVEPEDATKRAMKEKPSSRPVPAVLLARLAVDQDHQGAGLGRSLLQDALLRSLAAADSLGIRVVLVHGKRHAKAWYEKYGFEESPTDPLHLMVLIKDVRKSVEHLLR